jgi:hypothetical protein
MIIINKVTDRMMIAVHCRLSVKGEKEILLELNFS